MRHEILPFLSRKLLSELSIGGEACVEKAIKIIDAFALTKDDSNSIFDLMLGKDCNLDAFKAIPTATKAAFTRLYNKESHLLPYSTGTETSASVVKRINIEEIPGLDDEEESIDYIDADAEASGGEDTSKDKMIHQKTSTTKRATGTKTSAKRGRGAHVRGTK